MKKGLLFALGAFAADQLSKFTVLYYFSHGGKNIEVTGFFNIVLAWNKGVSFSMFHSEKALAQWVLTAVALLICGVIVHWMSMEKDEKTKNCFGLILGGALGNVADRLIHGAVVDFLDFHLGVHHWPAFNVADSAICIGAGFILLWNIFILRPEDGLLKAKNKDKQQENDNDSDA